MDMSINNMVIYSKDRQIPEEVGDPARSADGSLGHQDASRTRGRVASTDDRQNIGWWDGRKIRYVGKREQGSNRAP